MALLMQVLLAYIYFFAYALKLSLLSVLTPSDVFVRILYFSYIIHK